MKKILAVVLAAATMLSLAACGSSEPKEDTNTPAEEVVEEKAEDKEEKAEDKKEESSEKAEDKAEEAVPGESAEKADK